MKTGTELVEESLEYKNLPDMLAWVKELDAEAVYRWGTTIWEQRKKRVALGTQIISISAAIAVSGFVLAIATAIVTGILRMSGIL